LLSEQTTFEFAASEPSRQPAACSKAIGSLLFPLAPARWGLLLPVCVAAREAAAIPAMSFGRGKARVSDGATQTQVTFGDVAAFEGAKLELTEVV